MLLSGITLEHSLRTLSESAIEEETRKMCMQSLVELERGVSFGLSLAASGCLPREALLAIEAGEHAGELPMVLLMLGEYFERRSEMKKKIFSSLAYPLVVMTILSGVLFYIMSDVIPKVSGLLPAGSMSAPVTCALVGSAVFLKEYGYILTGGAGAVGVGIFILMRRYPSVYRSLLACIPIADQVMKEQELSMGFFALYVLQKSGVPLNVALREAAQVSGGLTERHMADCASYLIGGLALSEAVRQDNYFPRFTADILRVGEESGRFGEYFERLHQIFYCSFQSRMEYLAGVIRPALLVVAAGFIVLIAVGFLQPLYGNLSSIGIR